MGENSADVLEVAVILGSNRDGRFATVVADWFLAQMTQREDMHAVVIDPVETPTPTILPIFGQQPTEPGAVERLAEVSPRLAAADAFVIVTPEYNHSYPAALKQLIDWHHREWHAKPAGFVSYGGISGGLRAVEHLRGVLAELHAMTIRETVSFANAWNQFQDGQAGAEAEAAAKKFLDQLAWWAQALRRARAERPYTV
jgi:NAD(P)H-dependent FMN reductase